MEPSDSRIASLIDVDMNSLSGSATSSSLHRTSRRRGRAVKHTDDIAAEAERKQHEWEASLAAMQQENKARLAESADAPPEDNSAGAASQRPLRRRRGGRSPMVLRGAAGHAPDAPADAADRSPLDPPQTDAPEVCTAGNVTELAEVSAPPPFPSVASHSEPRQATQSSSVSPDFPTREADEEAERETSPPSPEPLKEASSSTHTSHSANQDTAPLPELTEGATDAYADGLEVMKEATAPAHEQLVDVAPSSEAHSIGTSAASSSLEMQPPTPPPVEAREEARTETHADPVSLQQNRADESRDDGHAMASHLTLVQNQENVAMLNLTPTAEDSVSDDARAASSLAHSQSTPASDGVDDVEAPVQASDGVATEDPLLATPIKAQAPPTVESSASSTSAADDIRAEAAVAPNGATPTECTGAAARPETGPLAQSPPPLRSPLPTRGPRTFTSYAPPTLSASSQSLSSPEPRALPVVVTPASPPAEQALSTASKVPVQKVEVVARREPVPTSSPRQSSPSPQPVPPRKRAAETAAAGPSKTAMSAGQTARTHPQPPRQMNAASAKGSTATKRTNTYSPLPKRHTAISGAPLAAAGSPPLQVTGRGLSNSANTDDSHCVNAPLTSRESTSTVLKGTETYERRRQAALKARKAREDRQAAEEALLIVHTARGPGSAGHTGAPRVRVRKGSDQSAQYRATATQDGSPDAARRPASKSVGYQRKPATQRRPSIAQTPLRRPSLSASPTAPAAKRSASPAHIKRPTPAPAAPHVAVRGTPPPTVITAARKTDVVEPLPTRNTAVPARPIVAPIEAIPEAPLQSRVALFCTSCGERYIADGARFCAFCGHRREAL